MKLYRQRLSTVILILDMFSEVHVIGLWRMLTSCVLCVPSLGQTYLMFCCWRVKNLPFSKKKKFDHVIELIYTHTRFVRNGLLWLSVEVVSGCTVLLGPESLTVPRRELLAIYCQG